MKKKELEAKKEIAKLLFMQGLFQKEIAERVEISEVTLSKWKIEGKWDDKRAASNITRPELTNKILKSISMILDNAIDSGNKNVPQLADQLTKLASSIEKLDKKNTVINDIETFTSFNAWLQDRLSTDNELTTELVKEINKFQDLYVHERLNK